MSVFIPTRHKNPCLVCGNVDGRCRQTETTHLCMNGTDGHAPEGFRFIGLSKDGQWGKFVEGQQSQEWTDEQRQQWKEQQARERKQREQDEIAHQMASFSPEKRDRYYRKLQNQLTLEPQDRADLHRRGLTDEQIKAIGIKSVAQWQRLETGLPSGLPGVNIDGTALNIPSAGYLVPINDIDGCLVGFQIRLRDASQGGRYRWLSSRTKKRPNGPTSHLPNGELPITVARPLDGVKHRLTGIGMAEGILKPIITAQKLGQVIIGAAGGQFSGSPEELKRSLDKLSEELSTKVVIFYPDAGAVENQTVMLQYHKTFSLLEEWGYQVQVAWWDQFTKDSPDIDEVDLLHPEFRYITPDQLINLALERRYHPIKDESEKASKLPHYGLTYAPDLIVNQRYLDITIPDVAGVICLRSGKGTGKTELIAKIVHQWLLLGKRVILLSHRVQLAQSLCDRVGIPSIYEIKAGHSQGNDSRILAGLQGFGLCADSLHPNSQAQFKAKEWADCLVIIDECEQVFWHTLDSETCKKDRVPILRELRELLANNPVILSDADLSDISIDLALKIKNQPDLKPWICLNTYKGSGYNSFFYSDKEDWFLKLEQALTDDERVLIIEDSQDRKGKYSTSNLERRFKTRFPDKRILRIDSETMERKDHPAYGCMSRLNELLLQYDIVICSPSVETGVSIDIRGHFNSVWGLFYGCIPENSARQALARVREPVTRHICAAPYGLGKITTGETDSDALLDSQHKLVKAKLDPIFDAARDKGINYQFMDAGLQTWAKFAARINTGMIQYAASIKAGLEAEGHTVNDYDGNDGEFDELQTKAISEAMKQNRNEHQWEHGQAISDAPLVTKEESQRLDESRSKANAEEQLKLKKYKLADRYSQEVTPELYLRDCEGWFPKIQLHYYLTIGRKHVKERDRSNRDVLTNDGQAWTPDLNRVLISDKVRMMERYRIIELLQKPEFRNDDPDLLTLHQQAIAEAPLIKRCLGVNITQPNEAKKQKGDTPIQVLKKLSNLIGLDLVCIRKEGPRKQQVRIYAVLTMALAIERAAEKGKDLAEWSVFALNDGREAVFSAWLARDEERQNQREAKQQPVTPPEHSAKTKMYQGDTVVTAGNKYIYTDRDYQTVTTEVVTTELSSLKPGDEVQVIESMEYPSGLQLEAGKVGIVKEVIHQGQFIGVSFNPDDDGGYPLTPVSPHHLKLIEPSVPNVSPGQQFRWRGEVLVAKTVEAAIVWAKRLGSFNWSLACIPLAEIEPLEAAA